MIVACIGAQDFERTPASAIELWDVLTNLVANEGADLFFFTNEGLFDFSCWQIVSQLKMRYPNIRRIYAQTGYEDNNGNLQEIDKYYDRIFYLGSICENSLLAPYVRNRVMVGMCDVVVTNVDLKKLPTPRIESSTEAAIKFAKRYKKRVINLIKN